MIENKIENNGTGKGGQIEPLVMLPTKFFRHLDLFSGLGGFALAAKSIWEERYENVGFCEIDKFCQRVLRKNFGEDIKIFDDISNLRKEDINGTVDLLTGGFPCQPFSRAGERLGEADERYLWEEMLRIISDIKPKWVIGENVNGIIDMALDKIITSLESIHYKAELYIIPASAVGMRHRRDRVWIIAYPSCDFSTSFGILNRDSDKAERWNKIQEEWCKDRQFVEVASIIDRRISGWQGEFPEPKLVRIPNGLPGELDKGRIKALGNAIVPQIAMVLLAALKTVDDNLVELCEVT